MNKAVRNISAVRHAEDRVSVIILAAGEANRMRSTGPRPLIRISSQHSIISYQLSMIKKTFPYAEVILVCGHDAERVMNNTPNDIIKVENETYQSNNVNRSIGLGLRAATGNIVVLIYGDLVFSLDSIHSIDLSRSSLVVDSGGLLSSEEVGCTFNDKGIAEKLFYDLPNKWAQIVSVRDKELELLRKVSWDRTKDKWFGFETINEMIECGAVLSHHTTKKTKVIDIDSVKDLLNVKKII